MAMVKLPGSSVSPPCPARRQRPCLAVALPRPRPSALRVHPGRAGGSKVVMAAVYGGQLVAIEGTYDDVNRFCSG